VPDLSLVLCPPYDIIPDPLRAALLARDPFNAVRLELPVTGSESDPDTGYRQAARALAEWRTEGVLVKDRAPAIYVHRMRWGGTADRPAGTARGFFARLRLEPFGPGAGVRPHERTMAGPKEDRFRLLKATGINSSPVVLLHQAGIDATGALLDRLTDREADACARTDDGVEHGLWVCPVAQAAHDHEPSDGDGQALLRLVGSTPVTIADGHHRYETALRYREERGQNRACESDPAWDYVLALLYETRHAPPALPTHRVLLTGPSGEELLALLGDVATVERVDAPGQLFELMARPEPPDAVADTGTGRIGVMTGEVAAILRVAPVAGTDAGSSPASRGLDVNRLAGLLARVGLDHASLAAGTHVAYVKRAEEAVARVDRGEGVAAFLLDPPPVTAVTDIAAAGEVMPQKSTYFDPKAPTGLLFGPLEW
jgi:uncharacterized protein (DUF1015 family)